jgi:hypothetical protein
VDADAAGLITGECFAIDFAMKTDDRGDALQRDPDDWKTGDEPMTDAQRSYLETLCRDTGEAFDATLSKADASKRIDELRQRSPRLTQE